jgi:hypothetical protein
MQPAASRDTSVVILNSRDKSGNRKIVAEINSFQRLEGVLLWFLPVLFCACIQQNFKELNLVTLVLQEPAIVRA